VLLDLFGTLVDFQSVFVSTLERILVDAGIEDRREDFRRRWSRFVFQGQSEGTFITVRQDFEDSLVAVLHQLGREGDLASYSHTVIDDMFEQLREAELFPEVPAVIAEVEAQGIPWAIVSNIDEAELRAIQETGTRIESRVTSELLETIFASFAANRRRRCDEANLVGADSKCMHHSS